MQQAAASRPTRPGPAVLFRHGDGLLLVLLGLPTAAIDWQIARTWSVPAWISLGLLGLVAMAVVLVIVGGHFREHGAAAAVALLYGLPIAGGIARWHLVPSTTALIGDGAYQIQLARDVLMRGVDPYGFNYAGTGLERAPWGGQSFANPALHHLDYWPGTIVLPLPVQAAVHALLGWWDERLWLLLAAVAVWVLLRRLAPGQAGRMAAITFFLIPGHSLLAVLGDNDLPMVALLLCAALAITNRRFVVAGLLIGLAVATKQTALIALPVLVVWAGASGMDWKALLRATGVAIAAVLALILPFLVWNAGAFVSDTLLYNFGSGAEAYPIQGLGLSSWLLQAGIIHGPRDAFPFLLLQIPLVIATWILAWRWMSHHRRSSGDAILWMGIAFFVFLFANRFAQQAYLLLGVELILAGLLARLHHRGHGQLALARPHRLRGGLPPRARHLGGAGPPPALGEDDQRDSVAH
jgi:uncharacterized membrane protein YqjE